MSIAGSSIRGNVKIPLSKPWIGAEEAQIAQSIVKSGWLISGPKVAEFEKRFAEKIAVRHAVAVNSGSSALLIAQQALGVQAGDEVIVPDMTFISTASSCMYLGAKPVFADIEMKTYCINPGDIKRRITKGTKGIIPVHYAGQSADMEYILEIAKRYGLFVLEDAAEAHLSEYKGKKAGGIGDIAIFSFTPSKPITTGEGGMITTNKSDLAKKCRLIRDFSDIGKFEYENLGFNFRMPEVMGGVGLVQLRKLEEAVRRRRSIAHRYTMAFEDLEAIITPFQRTENDINYQLYTIRLNLDEVTITRNQFIEALSEKGVSSRLYYPALHTQKVFTDLAISDDYPNTLEFARTALSLPIYPAMSEEEVSIVVEVVETLCSQYRRSL